jgi:hypothetical protein
MSDLKSQHRQRYQLIIGQNSRKIYTISCDFERIALSDSRFLRRPKVGRLRPVLVRPRYRRTLTWSSIDVGATARHDIAVPKESIPIQEWRIGRVTRIHVTAGCRNTPAYEVNHVSPNGVSAFGVGGVNRFNRVDREGSILVKNKLSL